LCWAFPAFTSAHISADVLEKRKQSHEQHVFEQRYFFGIALICPQSADYSAVTGRIFTTLNAISPCTNTYCWYN